MVQAQSSFHRAARDNTVRGDHHDDTVAPTTKPTVAVKDTVNARVHLEK